MTMTCAFFSLLPLLRPLFDRTYTSSLGTCMTLSTLEIAGNATIRSHGGGLRLLGQHQVVYAGKPAAGPRAYIAGGLFKLSAWPGPFGTVLPSALDSVFPGELDSNLPV
jgi:hypothetical protein